MIFDALANNIFLVWQPGLGYKILKNYFFLTGNLNSILAGFVNRGFLFATFSREIKSHVVESQITLLVCPCLSPTEKQHTINHMFILNDSVSFASAAFEAFAEAYLCFLVSTSAKKKKKMQKQLNSSES